LPVGDVIFFAIFLGALWLLTLAVFWRDVRRFRQGAAFLGRAQLVLRGLNSLILLAILVLLLVDAQSPSRANLVYFTFAACLLILVLLLFAFLDVRQVARTHQAEHRRLERNLRRTLVEVVSPPAAGQPAEGAAEPPLAPGQDNGRP